MASRGLLVVAAAAAALIAAGCAGSGYSYHANKSEKLYFKVPDDWTVFETSDFLDGAEPAEGLWVRGFSAGPEPSIDVVFDVTATQPRGYVQIVTLDPRERDGISLESLRSTLGPDESGLPIDPIAYSEEHPEQLQILGFDDHVALEHGPHGVHMRVALRPDGSDVAGIIDQTVLVDKATTKLYLLTIGCSAECFQAHEGEIEEVIESWTLEAT